MPKHQGINRNYSATDEYGGKTPEERAKELSGTGLPSPYRVAFSKSTNLTGEVEKEIHKHLDEYRLRSNREFFKADLKILKKTVEEFLTK